MQRDELRNLRERLLSETDPQKREEVVSQVLRSIQTEWTELFEKLSAEQNSRQMLVLLADLNDIIEQRKR